MKRSMVHLLVLAVVAVSDDGFLITTFMSFAFGGNEVSAWEESLHLQQQNSRSSQSFFSEKEKEFYG